MASLWPWRRARPARISRPRTSSRPSRRGAPTSTGPDAMRVLIADEFEQSGRDALHAMGCEVDFAPKLKDETLVAEVAPTRGEGLLAFNGARFRQILPADAGLRIVTSVLVLGSGRILQIGGAAAGNE